MFKIIPQEKILSEVEAGIQNELSELLAIHPSLKEKIIANLSWGVFSNIAPFVKTEDSKSRMSQFMSFSPSLFVLASAALKEEGYSNPIFLVDSVKKSIEEQRFTAYLNVEDFEVCLMDSQEPDVNPDFEGVVSLTLPDAELVFKELIVGDLFSQDRKNDWIFKYLDAYTDWQYRVMRQFHNYVWQFGGQGRWIQGDYNGSYIGQANIDIGDAGSVFFSCVAGQVCADIDMY